MFVDIELPLANGVRGTMMKICDRYRLSIGEVSDKPSLVMVLAGQLLSK